MLSSLILGFLIFAQPSSIQKTDFEVIREQGSLFSLKFVPGQPIKFYIVGREEAEVDLSKTKWAAEIDPANLSVSVKQTNSKPGKILKIRRFEDHYIVDDPLELTHGTELHLQIKDKKEKQPQSFKVKIKQQ
jgi:hypothetical protein